MAESGAAGAVVAVLAGDAFRLGHALGFVDGLGQGAGAVDVDIGGEDGQRRQQQDGGDCGELTKSGGGGGGLKYIGA